MRILDPTISTETGARFQRPVRVCYLIDNLARAGTESQLLALIQYLNPNRALPYLCLLDGSGQVSRELEPTNCPILRLGMTGLCRPRSLWKGYQLFRFLKRNKIDVLQTFFPDSTYLGATIGKLAGVPIIVRAQNNLGHWITPRYRFANRLLRRFLSFTVTNSEAAKRKIEKEEHWSPNQVVLLENGVDLHRFEGIDPLSTIENTRFDRLGIVANLRPIKRIDLLIDALAKVRQRIPDVSLRIAGDGDQKGLLQQQVERLNLSRNVTFEGKVQDVPRFLNKVQIAVLCSDAEGMSNALLEYMAAGRAIVATNVGASSRLIQNDVHGLLVRPSDPDSLANALTALCTNPLLAKRLGASARARAATTFSRMQMVKRVEDLYASWLISGGRVSGSTLERNLKDSA